MPRVALSFLLLIPAVLGGFTWFNPPDTAKQIRSHGYPVEEHFVTTDDGYILKLFRIPRGRIQTISNQPLLLVHPILCSSDCWTFNGPEHGLAYILADQGYDVWIANNRGNTYSQGHMTIPNHDPSFWDFSMHEMGTLDLPAMIDYILEQTDKKTLTYVGHSQGTTTFLIMASIKPEYQQKIDIATLMAPVAYVSNSEGLTKQISDYFPALKWFTNAAGMKSLFHNNVFTRGLASIVCAGYPLIGNWCENAIFAFAGQDKSQASHDVMTQVGYYCPAGASTKQVEHFLQLSSNGGKFTFFDYGIVENLVRYGTPQPPEYPLEKITQVPLRFFYSENDLIATPKEVEQLIASLNSSQIKTTKILFPDFSHTDFIWAMNNTGLVFDDAISQMVIYR